ncbi:hypothetical protein [Homoserinibacter sp. YIM 151385]|uniref:hypothetical protein n=1 Tax=Homoserinibacter sp. YIM 151385 TaxID=2985506 RepID=UPI0022F113CB|nr:hypothetical protein [Homoserinibacter sp. YIM 151385]WBU37649.1 hypothetical protein OF852_12115 [Homoserinibacter sp. YIM 151385]
MSRLRRVLEGERDAGISIAELVVTMMVSMILLAMVGSFFIQTAQVTSASNQTRVTIGDVTNMQNELTGRVRVASETTLTGAVTAGVTTAEARRLVFYAWSDTDAIDMRMSRVTVTVSASNIVTVQTCKGTSSGGIWSYPCTNAADVTTRTFDDLPLVNPSGSEKRLFTYWNRCGAQLGNASGTVASADLAKIQRIDVSVKAKTIGTPDRSALYLTSPLYLANIKSQVVCP